MARQYITTFPFVVLLFFAIISNLLIASVPYDGEYCTGDQIMHPPRLEIAIDADQTSEDMVTFLRRASGAIRGIAKEFPRSKFALTSFDDYPQNQGKMERTKNKTDPEKCYDMVQQLTLDVNLVEQKVKDAVALYDGYTENQQAALFFTACDLRVGWSDTNIDEDGYALRKVLILLTDDYFRPLGQGKPPQSQLNCRVDAVACGKFAGPNDHVVFDSLKKYEFSVFGVNPKKAKDTFERGTLVDYYRKYFNQGKILHDGMDDTSKNDDIVKTFTTFIKNSNKHFAYPCSDPPAYNILGL